MYADQGRKMPKDLVDYFNSKQAAYGAKIADEGVTNDPKKKKSGSDDVRDRAAANPGRLVVGSTASPSLPIGMYGTTTAVDNTAVPIRGMSMNELAPPPSIFDVIQQLQPDPIKPLAPKQPGPIPIKIDQQIQDPGGVPTPTGDSSFDMLYRRPTTSNIRDYVPGGPTGSRAFGIDMKGYNFYDEDKIPYGFKLDGQTISATPETLEKLRGEGIDARGQLMEDTLRELYDSNPEMFGVGNMAQRQATEYLNRMVMNEAKRGLKGDFSNRYYIPMAPEGFFGTPVVD